MSTGSYAAGRSGDQGPCTQSVVRMKAPNWPKAANCSGTHAFPETHRRLLSFAHRRHVGADHHEPDEHVERHEALSEAEPLGEDHRLPGELPARLAREEER